MSDFTSDPTPLQILPHRPHARAAISWELYDHTADPDRMQVCSFMDEHQAIAVAALMAAHLDEYRKRLNQLDRSEPFG